MSIPILSALAMLLLTSLRAAGQRCCCCVFERLLYSPVQSFCLLVDGGSLLPFMSQSRHHRHSFQHILVLYLHNNAHLSDDDDSEKPNLDPFLKTYIPAYISQAQYHLSRS